MNVTAWASGLEVTGDGTGIVSHAGLGLLRRLSDKTGLTRGLSQALFSGRLVHHDRGRVLADISCAIADGARAVSDFRVLADQAEAFGQVASVPTAYRTLEEITRGGARMEKKLVAAVSAARRYAWTQVVARHGKLPGVRVADKILEGVTCIRLDAAVTPPTRRKSWPKGISKASGIIRCWGSVITPAGSRWRGCCARAPRAATRPPITSAWWTRRSRRCRRRTGGT